MSCLCLQTIAASAAYRHMRNGVEACVQVSIRGSIRNVPFVEDENGNLRRAKHSRHEGIALYYCPLCGQELEKFHYQIWHDGPGDAES